MKKFTVLSNTLLKAILTVAPVVKDKNVIPIYDNLLFEVVGTKLKITAANQEVRASTIVEVDSSGDFSFCVEKSLVVTILSGLTHLEVFIQFDKNEVVISSTLGVYNLPIEQSELYPKQTVADTDSFMVDGEVLLDGLKKACPFVDESTENLNGVMLKSIDKLLYIVGASHNSFYEKEFPYNGDELEIYISTTAAKYIASSFDSDDPIAVSYNKTFFCVSCGDFSVEITQMNIKFPAYKKILDAIKKQILFKIPREPFLASIKRFQALCDKETKTLILDFDSNKVDLYFENTKKAFKAREVLDCVYNNEPFKIGFNINYLKSALNVLEQDEIEWYFYEQFKPSLFIEENTRILVSPTKFK